MSRKSENLVGRKFGKLLVVSRGIDVNKNVKWVCECECGTEKEIFASALRSGSTISCGCHRRQYLRATKPKDLTDRKFGRLKVIERDHAKQEELNSNAAYWKCQCTCGNLTSVEGSMLTKRGGTKSCGCFAKEFTSDRNRLIKSKGNGESSFNDIYAYYKRSAKRRGYKFSLTKHEFKEIIDSNCCYCGSSPSNEKINRYDNGNYKYNGVDRVDNDKGYVSGNCVPCCKHCNRMKSDFTLIDFLKHIRKIYDQTTDKTFAERLGMKFVYASEFVKMK